MKLNGDTFPTGMIEGPPGPPGPPGKSKLKISDLDLLGDIFPTGMSVVRQGHISQNKNHKGVALTYFETGSQAVNQFTVQVHVSDTQSQTTLILFQVWTVSEGKKETLVQLDPRGPQVKRDPEESAGRG